MNLTGNTIFITGGGSGIGRALAEALHKLGNQVIISGRRKTHLDATTEANPGMQSVELNIEDPASIAAVAAKLIADFPALNVLINNAGIMQIDDASAPVSDEVLVSTVTTNLLGPVRMTSALIEHLKAQPAAAVMNVTSGLAYTPMAPTAIYSATKAALHSYTLSERYKLKGTSVKVIEIVPPYVQTELMGTHQASDPRAMPLADYIAETIQLLGTDAEEILVQRVLPLRNNAGPNEAAFVNQFNDIITQNPHH
ncbi:SDR family NAD(P)-dependent oxidoreductase [Granulicella sp. WH15]|uniref:SDR family oxidoreductase n=1 Tax=Granulicella sp. WH15 TaxID=2602070 RepID=UPI00136760CD|nr:SDR family NAD(P)-dependent oxidoreductase [Granulicella sp. WH15]QHN02023.1 SDR family NAD(P)-dependent oxidoreductase [Granulicella sp. WH15]